MVQAAASTGVEGNHRSLELNMYFEVRDKWHETKKGPVNRKPERPGSGEYMP